MSDPMALDPLPPALLNELARRAAPRRPLPQEAPITSRLRVQMTEADRLVTRAAMRGRVLELWERAVDEPERTRVELAAVIALDLAEIAARMGLPPHEPGFAGTSVDELLAATLDTEGADLVVTALAAAAEPLAGDAVVLDIGEGHAARLRALAAAQHDLVVRGPSEDGPPADVAVALDLLHANTAADAVRALGALRVALAPGGHLVTGANGLHAFSRHVENGTLSPTDAAGAARGLYRSGHHQVGGRSYITLDWFGAHVVGPWALVLHAQGALRNAADVIVLQRRS